MLRRNISFTLKTVGLIASLCGLFFVQQTQAFSSDNITFLSTVGVEHGRIVDFSLTDKREAKIKTPKGLNVRDFSLSPDGKKIAFTALEDGVTDRYMGLYVADRMGRHVRRIYMVRSLIDRLSWSPDGTKIAFSSLNMDTGSLATANYEILIINPNNRHINNLTHSENINEFDPVWSPDGKRIAYATDIHAKSSPDTDSCPAVSICSVKANDNTDLQKLAVFMPGFAVHDPVWSPDGKKIAYAVSLRNETQSSLWVTSSDPSSEDQPQELTDEKKNVDRFPAWSPDGTKIAFSRSTDGKKAEDIYLIDLGSQAIQQLTSTPKISELMPIWR